MSLTTIIGQNDDGTYVVKHNDREFKGTAEAMAVHLSFHMEEIERLQARLAAAEKVVEAAKEYESKSEPHNYDAADVAHVALRQAIAAHKEAQ